MPQNDTDTSLASLSEERLRLEGEALAVEREPLAAARARAEAEAAMERKKRHPMLLVLSMALVGVICFGAGLLSGFTIWENRQQQLRELRLARALSQLDDFAAGTTNNAALPAGLGQKSPDGAHRNVAVMVIQ